VCREEQQRRGECGWVLGLGLVMRLEEDEADDNEAGEEE